MRFLRDMLQRFSRQVLTAGKADETVADENGPRPGHSIFTSHLLEASRLAAPIMIAQWRELIVNRDLRDL
jgi:hypothetical protein